MSLPELPEYWWWDVTRMTAWGGYKYVFTVRAHHVVIKGSDYEAKRPVIIVDEFTDIDQQFHDAYNEVAAEAFEKVAKRAGGVMESKIDKHLKALGASPFLLEDNWYTER